jgi:NAD(P)-dependent dehydrogenase (short-subunit alcohol dehydrogenase family)
MKTVLITGCSSGFGLETARYFLDRDWKVAATMRTPREEVLPPSERLRVLALDVTDLESVRRAVQAAGPIDVLVNNAGIGWLNALEGTPMATAREIFETNTLGTMAMTQAVLPQFRQRKAGVVVNVTSSVTFEAAPSTFRVHGQQGGCERVHRVACGGAPPIQCAREPGDTGTVPGDEV